MRRVKLIKDVVIEEVLCCDGDNFNLEQLSFIQHNPNNTPVHDTGEILVTDTYVKHVVPVKRLFKRFYNDVTKETTSELAYIAISPLVEEVFGGYIDVLVHEKEVAEASKDYEKRRKEETYSELLEARKEIGSLKGQLHKINKASFWKRLKYLFTGRLD